MCHWEGVDGPPQQSPWLAWVAAGLFPTVTQDVNGAQRMSLGGTSSSEWAGAGVGCCPDTWGGAAEVLGFSTWGPQSLKCPPARAASHTYICHCSERHVLKVHAHASTFTHVHTQAYTSTHVHTHVHSHTCTRADWNTGLGTRPAPLRLTPGLWSSLFA